MKIVRLLAALIALQMSLLTAQQEPRPHEKQVRLETSHGTIVLEIFPEAAPTHVTAFLKRIEDGFYVGTTFHRAVPWGIIQGGDPLTKDPTAVDRYGTGGLFELKREVNPLSHTRGALSAVLVPGQPDSAGSQFFICVTDQKQLDGEFTVYGRVVEGMEVVEQISQLETHPDQRIRRRVEILKTALQDRPPPPVIPFEKATGKELEQQRAVIRTDLGEIELEFYAEDAPEHVRQFLKFAALGLYDGTTFHRIVPSFVLQGGSLALRSEPVPARYVDLVKPLKLEISSRRKHVRGAVSMARSEDPESALDSFFIVLEDQPGLDGSYTVFGQVVRGMEVADMITLQPLAGESPVKPLRMTVEVLDPVAVR